MILSSSLHLRMQNLYGSLESLWNCYLEQISPILQRDGRKQEDAKLKTHVLLSTALQLSKIIQQNRKAVIQISPRGSRVKLPTNRHLEYPRCYFYTFSSADQT